MGYKQAYKPLMRLNSERIKDFLPNVAVMADSFGKKTGRLVP
jgi:hypothetical protein